MKYRLKAEYTSLEPQRLVTQMGPDIFTLDSKPYKHIIPASKTGPEKVIDVPVATQEQLKRLFELKHGLRGKTLIEEVDTKGSSSSPSS